MSKEETPQQSATENKSATNSASAEGAGKAAKKAEAPRFILAASPFFLEDVSTPKIMHTVVMALVPAMAASIYFFGFRALLLLVICIASSMVTEAIFQRFRKRPITVYDGSAIITGPSDSNIVEDIAMLGAGDGVLQVGNIDACWSAIRELLDHPERAQALGQEAHSRLARQPDVIERYLDAISPRL